MADTGRFQRLHRRYVEQARWTAATRHQLVARLASGSDARWLEVGAGTGAIAADLAGAFEGSLFALDVDLDLCRYGVNNTQSARWTCGDAHSLPVAAGTLDAVVFHYVLLWLDDPAQALAEAARVTRPGGWILAMAEPDHAARLDFPELLARLGQRQTEALAAQSADVRMGRKMRALFAASGLSEITVGLLGGEWSRETGPGDSAMEWETLRADLAGSVPPADLDVLEDYDRDAWRRGERLLFVPTFYAAGRMPWPPEK